MDASDFLSWFEKLFLLTVAHLCSLCVVVLFMDDHHSYINLGLIQSARKFSFFIYDHQNISNNTEAFKHLVNIYFFRDINCHQQPTALCQEEFTVEHSLHSLPHCPMTYLWITELPAVYHVHIVLSYVCKYVHNMFYTARNCAGWLIRMVEALAITGEVYCVYKHFFLQSSHHVPVQKRDQKVTLSGHVCIPMSFRVPSK